MYCASPSLAFQSVSVLDNFARRFLRNLFTRSTIPLAHGAATATNRCLIKASVTNSVNSQEEKAVPLSVTIVVGLPYSQKMFCKCAIVSRDVDLTALSHVNRVKASTIIRICLNR